MFYQFVGLLLLVTASDQAAVGQPATEADSAQAAVDSPHAAPQQSSKTVQVVFVGPEGMTVNWDVTAPGRFDSEPLVVPGRCTFPEAASYRLRLSNVPDRPNVEVYPTLEIAPYQTRTAVFVTHNAVPVQFTPEDFDQVLSGNFVTKVIYLPDPEFQELSIAGIETLVSTRLDPGVDPIVEAKRRGAILAIVRISPSDVVAATPWVAPSPTSDCRPCGHARHHCRRFGGGRWFRR
jgi:hypothetical protein